MTTSSIVNTIPTDIWIFPPKDTIVAEIKGIIQERENDVKPTEAQEI